MGKACSTHGREAKCIRNFGRKSRTGNSTRKSRHAWKDNIRMDLREIGWERVDWMHLVQDRDQWLALVNTVTNLRVP
jgi:hypothetical protein